MAEMFNPLDAQKWRNLIAEFDVKRIAFFDDLSILNKERGATPELEAERRTLIKSAKPIQASVDALMNSLQGMRGFFKGLGRFFGLGSTPDTMGELGIAPVLLVIGLGAAAAIVASITKWLTKSGEFKAKNELAKQLAQSGATPAEIIAATKGGLSPTSSAKILGFDVRWLLAIGAMFIVAPYALKFLKERR